MDGRLTITEVAQSLNVTSRTIMRWEKTGKIKRSKRDWRGWRFYTKEDLEEIRKFYEAAYESIDETKMNAGTILRNTIVLLLAVTNILVTSVLPLDAQPTNFAASPQNPQGIRETADSVDIVLDELPGVEMSAGPVQEATKYTLGPNDVISIDVRRHPEFNGQYAINAEGKIGYKYVGDIIASGLTKKELAERLTDILSEYLIRPEVDVQIVSYLSKVVYVVGDVGRPGKFYMKGDTITVREAIVQAGLPTQSASLGSCRLITPSVNGKDNYRKVNMKRLLYEGDLRENLVMEPGDVLYVPATLIAKMIRVISPVTSLAGQTAGSVAQGAALAL